MEKHIVKWSYWLGLACALIAFVMRGLHAVGVFVPDLFRGANLGYMSYYKAAFLLLAIAIATATTTWATAKKE